MKPSYKIKAASQAGQLLALCLMAGPAIAGPHVAMGAGRPWPAPQMGAYATHRPHFNAANRLIGGATTLPASGVFGGPGFASESGPLADFNTPRPAPVFIAAPSQPNCVRPLLIELQPQKTSGAPLPRVVYGTPLPCPAHVSGRF